MTLSEIVTQGECLANENFYTPSETPGFPNFTKIRGSEYIEWVHFAYKYIETHYPDDSSVKEFKQTQKSLEKGYSVKSDHIKLISILRSLDMVNPPKENNSNDDNIKILLKKICLNFGAFDRQINTRRENRPSISINDEYDQQDVLHAILKLFFKDIRPEDYVPSYAGGNSRIDFYIPTHNLYIENKITSDTLKDRKLGEQLAIDVARYSGKTDCKILFFSIYDKGHFLANPYGLKNDIEKLSTAEREIIVHIAN